MQQSIVFLCTGDEQPVNEIKETIPVAIVSRRIRYVKKKTKTKNVTKEVQGLYSEDYKTLLKEIIEDLNRKKSVFTVRRFTVLEMTVIPKLTNVFSKILIKIPAPFFFFFTENDKLLLQLIWKCKSPKKVKEQRLEDSQLPNFKNLL